jgi:hypothetical protein
VFGDFIRDVERLIRVLIEKLLIVADVRPVHLSVGVLGFSDRVRIRPPAKR